MTSSAGPNSGISEPDGREGLVFNIQRHSVHDGPGIRTVLFLKGCGLRCLWCSNPESQSFEPELFYNPDACIACGACIGVCPERAIGNAGGRIEFSPVLCSACGACCEVCYAEARIMEGRRMTAEEAADEVSKDAPFFLRSGGGVTLSGGEPLAQTDFASEVLRLCKERGFHTAIETAGLAPWNAVEKVLPHTDLFLYDVKHPDAGAHERGTGTGNEIILGNLRGIAKAGAAFIVRTPVVPGFNDDLGTLSRIARLAAELGALELHLLPYHRYGSSKYRLMGKAYPMGTVPDLPRERAEEFARELRGEGVDVKVGG